jgi:hypothetical protein
MEVRRGNGARSRALEAVATGCGRVSLGFGEAGVIASGSAALRQPRFTLHFTPTYSSWLNLVERWFAELTNRKLRRSERPPTRSSTTSRNT